MHITRICEVRQLDNLGFQTDFGLLSDDKALRYTSKAASLLGEMPRLFVCVRAVVVVVAVCVLGIIMVHALLFSNVSPLDTLEVRPCYCFLKALFTAGIREIVHIAPTFFTAVRL